MASLVGMLRVVLGLDSAAFEEGAKRAGTSARGVEKDMLKLNTGLGTVARTLGVVAGAFIFAGGITAVKNLIKEGLDYATSLKDVSEQLGITTGELQEYRYVASQVGIDQAEMDRGLQRLAQTLSRLATGSKEPVAAFKELGLSTAEMAGISKLSAGEALPLLADAFADIPDPAAAAAVAAKLFGEELGPKFLALLRGGRGEIDNLRVAARELGIVLSDEQIQRADETANKLAQVKTVLSARVAGFVADNAEAIYKLANALLTLTTRALQAASAWINWSNTVDQRSAQHKIADAILDKRKDLTAAQRERAKELAREKIDARLGVRETVSDYGLFKVKRTTIAPKKAGSAPTVASSLGDIAASGAALDKFSARLDTTRDRTRAATRQMKSDFDDTAKAISSLLDRVFPEVRKLRDYYSDSALLEKAGLSPEKLAEGQDRLRREFFGVLDNDKGIGPGADMSSDPLGAKGMANAAQAMEGYINTLDEKAREARVKVAKSFKDMADDTVSSLQRMNNAIRGGGFIDILSALIGMGLQLGSIGAFGKTIAGNINRSVPGYAGGTSFHPGGLAMVGERGPELVNLPRGSQVWPNGRGPTTRVEIVDTTGLFVTRVAQVSGVTVQAAAPGIAQGTQQLMQRRQSRQW